MIIKEEGLKEEGTKRKWIIYMYTFPNGRRYIGKTMQNTLKARQKFNMVGYRNSKYIYNAIQKYGPENIKQEIIFEGEISDEYASRLEQIYILTFKTNVSKFEDPRYGYNLTDGGGGMIGWKPVGEEYERRKIQLREALTHRKYGPLTEEHKRKCSEALKRENLGEDIIKRRNLAESFAVKVTDTITNEISYFETRKEAIKYYDVCYDTLKNWINNKIKSRKYPNLIFENMTRKEYNELQLSI